MVKLRYLTLVILSIAASAILVGSGYAVQTKTPKSQMVHSKQTKPAITATDHKFVEDTAMGNMAEVKLGELAKQKGSTTEVKNFGQRMIDDHTKANDSLKQLAVQKSITFPGDVSATDKATYDRLSKLSGRAFDRAYLDEMVKGHEKVAASLRHEESVGKDPDVKSWASKTLPTVEEHLKMARTDYGHTTTTSKKHRPMRKISKHVVK